MAPRALVLGSSGGIGAALVAELTKTHEINGLSRSVDGFDITDEDSVNAHLSRLEGPFARVVVATGALEIGGAAPEKSLRDLSPQGLLDQFALNAMGPALVLRHAQRLLPKDTPCVFAVLSARVGSIGDNRLGGWYSYRAAKAAVNQIVHTAAIEISRTHRQAAVIALHPGTVATPFTAKYLGRHPAVAPAEAAANLVRVMDGVTAAQTGGFFDWAGKEVPW
ncbi:SDR family oxidoreductase [Dinoroseobacter sp. PD6]|uniref:SDR family oxidoreductase n=1 Tax=Dinoroseobacter sp. PD6 TaxID=3028384 RepID=UPI00237B4CE9|nr:SDR family oxidoreductase [Dinoroseobacter sp. PD6]MDD9717551.1 SDR family oxidoreductase [Dinoroseobacter sp. PD6]